jgi:hypothetical protein
MLVLCIGEVSGGAVHNGVGVAGRGKIAIAGIVTNARGKAWLRKSHERSGKTTS